MWYYGNAMGFFGWTMMILFWAAMVAVIIWAVRSSGATRGVPRSDALALLERRFAAGEIEQDDFKDKKRLLKET